MRSIPPLGQQRAAPHQQHLKESEHLRRCPDLLPLVLTTSHPDHSKVSLVHHLSPQPDRGGIQIHLHPDPRPQLPHDQPTDLLPRLKRLLQLALQLRLEGLLRFPRPPGSPRLSRGKGHLKKVGEGLEYAWHTGRTCVIIHHFYIALFSVLKQTHCAHVACSYEWVTVYFYSTFCRGVVSFFCMCLAIYVC